MDAAAAAPIDMGWAMLNSTVLDANATSSAPWLEASLARTWTLSERERQVFRLLADGMDNRSIARRLGVAERTTKRHLSQVMAKLGCESRLQVGLVALIERLLDPEASVAFRVASRPRSEVISGAA